jgi:hypothetical protein
MRALTSIRCEESEQDTGSQSSKGVRNDHRTAFPTRMADAATNAY